MTGDDNIQLTASGDIQVSVLLKPMVSGQLRAMNAVKQQATRTMDAGVVPNGEIMSTKPMQ